MLLLYGVPVVAAVLYAAIVLPPTRWAKGTGGGLLGEVHIRNGDDAHAFADKCVSEAFALWDEPSSNWERMHDASDLTVEVRRITEGPFRASGLLLTRAEGVVEGADPDAVFEFLTSVDGLLMLDPNLDPEEAHKNIESYAWKGRGKGSHLDVHESFMHSVPPGMEERYYIVLNGYDLKKRLFFCKSVVHDAKPGSSMYYEDGPVPTDDPRVRAVNTFYFQMTPTADGKSTLVKMVNYADLRMGSTIFNWILAKVFYPGVFDGLRTKFSSNKDA